MQVGVGPNIEADGKSAYNNVQVGVGPNIENFEKKFYRQCKLAGPQHREIGFLISTDNASWRGPNTEKLDSQFLQTMQVGVGRR
ncbi:TPA: hypothetical protein ACH98E_000853 [Staphylococcus aureus]|nr:hypothetical protein [Staphylococcus aureus]